MKYLSIDVEGTGLNMETCQVIQFAAILEDTNNLKSFEEIPKFVRYVKHSTYTGEAFALQMNYEILKVLADHPDTAHLQHLVCYDYELAFQFESWLIENGYEYDKKGYIYVNIAGKNVIGYDLSALSKSIPHWNLHLRFRQRAIDPAILYVDWKKDDTLPGLVKCKKRAGLSEHVSHDALEDAWDVLILLRFFYQPK